MYPRHKKDLQQLTNLNESEGIRHSPFAVIPNEVIQVIYDYLKPSDMARFSRTCKLFSLFGCEYKNFHLHLVLKQIARGNRREAMMLINDDPGLLLEMGQVKDHACRRFKKVTPLQFAFGALDHEMCNLILKAFNRYRPDGSKIALAQLHDRFGDQLIQPSISMAPLFDFSDLITAFINHQEFNDNESLEEANKSYDAFLSAHQPAVNTFGWHFNFDTYLRALTIYATFYAEKDLLRCTKNATVWYQWQRVPKWNSELGKLFWVGVIGHLQRLFTACQAQDLCRMERAHINPSEDSQNMFLEYSPQGRRYYWHYMEECLEPDGLGVTYAIEGNHSVLGRCQRLAMGGGGFFHFIERSKRAHQQRIYALNQFVKTLQKQVLKEAPENETRSEVCRIM